MRPDVGVLVAAGRATRPGFAGRADRGAGTRLDFTCIGPAVNMAARLEKVAARLQRAIVGSAAFARRLPKEFVELGAFELAGFRSSETVYGLRGTRD